MKNELEKLLSEGIAEINGVGDENALRECEVKYLGRKSALTDILRGMKDLPVEEKKDMGQLGNKVKNDLAEAIESKKAELENKKLAKLATEEWQDPTLQKVQIKRGRMHPINDFIKEVERVFSALGFEVASGPEIEDQFHNFEALNIPADHPARDSQDTFFLKNFPDNLLRTHTSNMQIRWCENHELPVRVICPGKVFRKDELDATHSPIFYQFEGLVLDKKESGISLANLKGTIEEAFKQLLGENTKFRFRTSYFPFVEPGLEVDVTCPFCDGAGCRVCKNVGWLEMLGCGMVHPNVIKHAGFDPEEVQGFAFGVGIDRMVMIRHRIPDIRYLYENDQRFLEQF